MSTATISLRIPKEEADALGELARRLGMEKSVLLRQALRQGAREVRLEQACRAYRRGEITFSRAAELAGLTLRELVAALERQGVELSYDAEDLRKDLRPLPSP